MWNTFTILSLVISFHCFQVISLFQVLKGQDNIQCLLLNFILFLTLFIYILIDGLSIFSPCFFRIYLKKS